MSYLRFKTNGLCTLGLLTGVGEGRASGEALVGAVHGFMKIDCRLDVTAEQNAVVVRSCARATVLNNKSMDNTATDARWDPSEVYSELLAADVGVRAAA